MDSKIRSRRKFWSRFFLEINYHTSSRGCAQRECPETTQKVIAKETMSCPLLILKITAFIILSTVNTTRVSYIIIMYKFLHRKMILLSPYYNQLKIWLITTAWKYTLLIMNFSLKWDFIFLIDLAKNSVSILESAAHGMGRRRHGAVAEWEWLQSPSPQITVTGEVEITTSTPWSSKTDEIWTSTTVTYLFGAIIPWRWISPESYLVRAQKHSLLFSIL